MNDPSQKSNQTISKDLPNATSSPASEDGLTLSDSQDGPMTDLFGQEVVHASPSARRGKALSPTIRATFGLPFSSSLKSADLQLLLENRLRARMDGLGLILFSLTWKEQTTASGRRICALLASGRRTSDSDFIGWGTPTSRDHKDGVFTPNVEEKALLGREVWQTGWPTVQARDWKGPEGRSYKNETRDLPATANLASWPTPDKSSGDGGRQSADPLARTRTSGTKKQFTINEAAQIAPWPTPMAGSPATETYNEAGDTMGGRKTRLLVSGPTSSGSPAATANPGQLNPRFSLWLMGYPTEWAFCGERVMRSSLRSPQSSSERIAQQLKKAEAELERLKSQL